MDSKAVATTVGSMDIPLGLVRRKESKERETRRESPREKGRVVSKDLVGFVGSSGTRKTTARKAKEKG